MVWVSVITLLVSLATLALVWQMQKNMAHTDADAAERLTLVQRQQNNCEGRGGTWTQGSLLGHEGDYHCHEKDGKTINDYDSKGIQTIPGGN